MKLIEKDGYCISDIEFLLKNGVDIEWFDEISNIKRLLDERQSKDIIDIQNRSKGSRGRFTRNTRFYFKKI